LPFWGEAFTLSDVSEPVSIEATSSAAPVAEAPPTPTVAGDEPVNVTYATPALATAAPTVLHSGMTVPRYFAMHVMGGIFPVTACLLVFGWRAFGAMVVVMGSALAAAAVWKRIGKRGAQVNLAHVTWLSLLLSMMLPAHLFSTAIPWISTGPALWPILVGAAIVLVMFTWVLGGVGSSRVHPGILTFLLLVVVFRDVLVPHGVLQLHDLFAGDVTDVGPSRVTQRLREPWLRTATVKGQDALWREPASQSLIFYTSGNEKPERRSLSLEDLLRDRMPPLEDLIVGGSPGPLGGASAIAVIIGGLFLLYHGLIDFRIPLLIFLSAFLAFLLMPVPVVITESALDWRWLPLREPGVGWKAGVTFVNYEMLAGPLPLMAFFFATSAAVRPMYRRGRALFAVAIGVLSAGFQLYVDVASGPYIALFAVSLLTPAMDRWFRPRTLV
jgi:Na+-translocating ferredoxin:NAD+ oxidoreductase RnfD subunit